MPPEPQYHGWFEDPPAYDGTEDMFSVQVDHGGFFCSVRGDLTYECGTTEYFDNCSSETFSLFWIEEFLRHLGYEMDDMVSVYWQKPGKDLLDGLQCIESDSDIVDMIEGRMEEKTLALLIDHKNFLKTFMPDVVEKKSKGGGSKGDGEEDAIASQGNTIDATTTQGNIGSTSVSGGSKGDEEGGFSDSESDSTFNDSDYDVEDGDDDLFTDNIDKEVLDHNEPVNEFELEDDSALQDTSLILRQEHEEDLQQKFSVFNPQVDMEDPVFKPGLVFSTVEELRLALNAYSVRNRVKVTKLRNDKRRLDAVCKTGCPWFFPLLILIFFLLIMPSP